MIVSPFAATEKYLLAPKYVFNGYLMASIKPGSATVTQDGAINSIIYKPATRRSQHYRP